MSRTPWIGLVALIAMFVIPFLPAWLFEGPRVTKHWPHRHVCGYCGALWTNDHTCLHEREVDLSLCAELRQLKPGRHPEVIVVADATDEAQRVIRARPPLGEDPAVRHSGREGAARVP
jgi:hypothetical protein